MTIYYSKKTRRVYIVPPHYSHSLDTIDKLMSFAKEVGLTLPTERTEIKVEVLRGRRHNRQISLEFETVTPPQYDYRDIDEYPSYNEYLVY